MGEYSLQGSRILVVEDEYLLADDLFQALTAIGADVIGPVPSLQDATAVVARETRIDAAILDVNLRGDMVFPLADALAERGIPFAFVTGYDQWSLPERFASRPRMEKPFKAQRIAALLGPLLVPAQAEE